MCYKSVNKRRTYAAAAQICLKLDGILAQPTCPQQNSFIRNSVGLPKNSGTWIGLNDKQDEGSFEWENGDQLSGWTNWARGRPKNPRRGNRTDCVVIKVNGQWEDIKCQKTRRFVCEMEAVSIQASHSVPVYNNAKHHQEQLMHNSMHKKEEDK